MKGSNFCLTIFGVCLGGMILLAAFQGFYTSKSVYTRPQGAGDGEFGFYIKASTSPQISNKSSPTISQLIPATKKPTVTIQWKLYGKEKLGIRSETMNTKTQGFNVKKQHLLKSVPTSFQESMLSALPLDCHPGPEGVFKEMHSGLLRTLAEYATSHSQMKKMPSSRTLIWRCGGSCAGLGDRIRGLTYTLLLAVFSRRRLVVLLDHVHEGKYLHPNMIDWRDEAAYQYLRNEKSKTLPFSPPFSFAVGAVRRNGVTVSSVPNNKMAEYLEIVNGNRTNVLIGVNLRPSVLSIPSRSGNQEWLASAVKESGLSDLSHDDFDAVMGLGIRFLFKFDDEVLRQVQLARDALGLTGPYTALHVRTGFVGMPHDEHSGLCKLVRDSKKWLENYRSAVSAADRSLGKNSPIYLATDSNKVKDLAIQKYPHRFRSLNNALVHVNALTKYYKTDSLKTSAEEGILVVWVEMMLLAQANTLVRGESGFSWIAGLLCGLSGNRTVVTSHLC